MRDETCRCGDLVMGRHHVRYTHARYHTRTTCAATVEPEEAEVDRLRRRVAALEGRLARVLRFVGVGGVAVRWMRGNVWSSRRTGGKR